MFLLHGCCGEVEDSVRKPVNNTSGCYTPTDRPKSVRNRCVIELFGSVFVLSLCLFDFSACVGVFPYDLFLFYLRNREWIIRTLCPPMRLRRDPSYNPYHLLARVQY